MTAAAMQPMRGAEMSWISVKPYKVVYSLTDSPKDPVSEGHFSDVKVALEDSA